MRHFAAALLLGSAMGATAAAAAVINFNGTATASGVVTADPSCAPLFRGVATGAPLSGMSSLGAFTYNHSVCTPGGPGALYGTFSIVFAGDQFDGTLFGVSTPVGDGTFTQQLDYSITGGTGRFAGGTGGVQVERIGGPPGAAVAADAQFRGCRTGAGARNLGDAGDRLRGDRGDGAAAQDEGWGTPGRVSRYRRIPCPR